MKKPHLTNAQIDALPHTDDLLRAHGLAVILEPNKPARLKSLAMCSFRNDYRDIFSRRTHASSHVSNPTLSSTRLALNSGFRMQLREPGMCV
jgi:hypothetical protein